MSKKPSIYLIGALKNRDIVKVGERLRKAGFEVFEDWTCPGPEADSYLLEYYKARGFTYKDALNSYGAQHVFHFDKSHLDRCDIAVMVMKAGKSAHLELGYMRGLGKPGYVLFDEEPERFDVMYNFCTDVFFDVEDLVKELKKLKNLDLNPEKTTNELLKGLKGFEDFEKINVESGVPTYTPPSPSTSASATAVKVLKVLCSPVTKAWKSLTTV